MNEHDMMRSVCTGIRKERDATVRYEVHRERGDARYGKQVVARPPLVEEFFGLDRARVAALGYALEGSSQADGVTGVIRIFQKLYSDGGTRLDRQELIDVIDERVAWRLLNEISFPHADQLAVSVAQLQAEVDALLLH